MASAGARAYNGGLAAEPPAGVQGAEPRWPGSGGEPRGSAGAYNGRLWTEPPAGVQGSEPPAADEVFVFKRVIFDAPATDLHEMVYCLSCFFCKVSK